MEAFAGMVANGFIVLINCIDWFRSRKLSPTDLILICLGLSRLTWHALAMLHGVMIFIFRCIYTLNHKDLKLPVLWFITDNINLWFATWLSALYLLKIATFSHPVFLQVKLRFSGLVPWLLLSSVVFSVFMTIVIMESNSGLALSVLCDNVSALYPSVHGVILILINPKLRQAWVRMIQHLKRGTIPPPPAGEGTLEKLLPPLTPEEAHLTQDARGCGLLGVSSPFYNGHSDLERPGGGRQALGSLGLNKPLLEFSPLLLRWTHTFGILPY
ncbi:taste receptor type 2 member 41-like [Sphaerodactylus townsendi]|uniref:taste receptor type 2 member 41-like n=1 Tax=Sphaerodactylus townsendi TaxID=933632 RepID=UPI002026C880|nr:taste receptor type 2 member 41-like [Sphaerodactylus townsendi]